MANTPPAPDRFHPLPPPAAAHLDRQRAYVAELVRESFPEASLSGGRSDLPLLQAVVDAHVLRPDQTWELQSLGVAFGDVLVGMIGGLAWCEVTDRYGTDPTLRYRETSFQLNALTMISKRVEAGEPVDLQDLATWAAEKLAELDP